MEGTRTYGSDAEGARQGGQDCGTSARSVLAAPLGFGNVPATPDDGSFGAVQLVVSMSPLGRQRYDRPDRFAARHGQKRSVRADWFWAQRREDLRMSLNAMSAVRIGALLAAAIGCAWGTGQYMDVHAFEQRNAAAMAICSSLTPGMAVADAERRAHSITGAAVTVGNERLVVRIPGQSLCVAEIANGQVRSAAVARNG